MTRSDCEQWARSLYEDAIRIDPHHIEEVVEAITGRVAWCWHLIPLRQVRAIGAACFRTVRMA